MHSMALLGALCFRMLNYGLHKESGAPGGI